MKTILSRMKTLIDNNNNDGGTLSYVKHFEVIHPEVGLTVISLASLPAILLVPVSASEVWIASKQKENINIVYSYLVLSYHQRESSIMGDSTRPAGQGKGILDFISDFLSVFRGHMLGTDGVAYLSKPLDILNIDQFADTLGENAQILVAQVQMECRRLFLQTTISTNV